MTLVYTIEGEGLADVRALDSVTCAIEGPEASQCEALGELVDVRVQGSARSYVFELAAPATPGDYTARFSRAALVGVALPPDGGDESAETTFTVLAPTDDGAGGTDANGGDRDDGDTLTPGSIDLPPGDANAPRWLASIFLATGATAASVVLARRGPGAR